MIWILASLFLEHSVVGLGNNVAILSIYFASATYLLCKRATAHTNRLDSISVTETNCKFMVTPWSFCLAIHQISSHRCCGLPMDPLTVRCGVTGVCSSNASTIALAGFATSTTWNSVSSRSGVASTRTSLTEQFDSGMSDYARVSLQTAATLRCFCVRTAKATFPYWKILFLSSIFKQLLLSNCAVDFAEICNVYVGKMIIEAAMIRYAVQPYIVIVIWISASLFLEHSVFSPV